MVYSESFHKPQGLSPDLINELKVPIVDASVVSFKFAEMLVDLKKKMGFHTAKSMDTKALEKLNTNRSVTVVITISD